jgi:hypothetical protein
MKVSLLLLGTLTILFFLFQIYTAMATEKTETQPYKVIKIEKDFEVRYYPATTMAMISSSARNYKELSNSGFKKLAGYIFGGNKEKKQIAMTSPVHMDIEDGGSSMGFVMPANYNKDNLPLPNNSDVTIKTIPEEYVAAIRFGGFASGESITKHRMILENALKEKGYSYYGNFRYLGYNPPFQIFGRRNEVIVALNWNSN